MNNTWKIYMLASIGFLVGTSQFVIVGILDKVAASVGVSVSSAGQLITVFALASAIGTPLVMVATAKMNQFLGTAWLCRWSWHWGTRPGGFVDHGS